MKVLPHDYRRALAELAASEAAAGDGQPAAGSSGATVPPPNPLARVL